MFAKKKKKNKNTPLTLAVVLREKWERDWKNKGREEKKRRKSLQGMLDKRLYFPSGKGLHDNPLGCRFVICHNIESLEHYNVLSFLKGMFQGARTQHFSINCD